MPINASVDTFNQIVSDAQEKINSILEDLGKDLGNYGLTGTVGTVLACSASGADKLRPMSLSTEAQYGFKGR